MVRSGDSIQPILSAQSKPPFADPQRVI
jgi:hypothetical protein